METEHSDAALEADLLEVVEAILFVSDEPVPASVMSTTYGEVTGQEGPSEAAVESAVNRLNEIYTSTGRIFRVHRWGGGFQIATEPRVDPFLRALMEAQRIRKMSRSLLETLAVVAYRQPISKPEVDSVRGVDASYALRKLLESGFVEIVGRSDTVGRPLIYGTTDQFLIQFGLDSTEDLPRLKELDELMKDPDLYDAAKLGQVSGEIGDKAAPAVPEEDGERLKEGPEGKSKAPDDEARDGS